MVMDQTCEINDNYEHLDDNLEYILENVLSEYVQKNIDESEDCKQLYDVFNTILLNKCECSKDPLRCLNCCHGSNYNLDEKYQELVLNDSRNMPNLIYECTNMCLCKPNRCLNRLVQYGPRKFLKIVYSAKYCSKGLITTQDIPKGAFICEYAGELLTTQEAKNISRKNEIEEKMNYVLVLRESCLLSGNNNDKMLVTIINPSEKGNIGRYLNHCCDPNCYAVSVRIDCPIPKVAIFSMRHIKAGEEICFNYNEGTKNSKIANASGSKRIPCLCGSQNCAKYLPNSEFF